MLKKYSQKWKEKKLFDKVSDLVFIIFIIAILIPPSRTAILVSVKRVFAFAPRSISEDERVSLSEDSYHWELVDIQGHKINVSDLSGKTLFINEWATWCPPCIAEMPSIQKLYDEFKDDENVSFLLITNEDKDVVVNFIEENDYSIPVYLAISNTPQAFFSPSIPTTFLVSPEGEIVLKEVGSKKWHGENVIELIRSLSH